MKLFKSKNIFFLTALVLIICLLLAGCNVLQSQGLPGGDEGEFETIDLSGEDDDSDGDEDEDFDSSSADDPPTIQFTCPSEMTEFGLFLSHSWDFSPNRDLDKMKVDGQTEPSSPCLFSVVGSTVIMEQCRVSINNTGYIKSNDGTCDITASGTALVSIEDASCKNGVITMTIVETIDADSGSGAMNCPDLSQPYFPFYPFSRSTLSFQIQMGGSTLTENVDPDISGQFRYDKEWTVHSENLGSPIVED